MMVLFPPQTPAERAAGDAWWAAFDRDTALARQHQADQFHARLHQAIEAGIALGSQCTCGAAHRKFRES